MVDVESYVFKVFTYQHCVKRGLSQQLYCNSKSTLLLIQLYLQEMEVFSSRVLLFLRDDTALPLQALASGWVTLQENKHRNKHVSHCRGTLMAVFLKL